MKKSVLFCIVWFSVFSVVAQPKLPYIFSDHMVLQREKPIHVWGTAGKSEKITVTLNGKSASGKADRAGRWHLILAPMAAGGPYTLGIQGKNLVQVQDVMVGDVWLCSGQSNMEWPLAASNKAKEEIAAANYPMIRHFKVPNTVSLTPERDFTGGKWETCSPATAARFTAVGYFFAREIVQHENVAIGLLNSSWGGTHVETWTSGPAFFSLPEFSSLKSKMPADFNQILAEKKKQTDELVAKFQGQLPARSEVNRFKDPAFDDQAWSTLKAPELWESQFHSDIDGEIWFRKSFQVPADISLKDVKISLGKIDDQDSTFINGIFIGATNAYNESRVYTVPAGVIKASGNVVSVKINDTGGGGGFYGDAGEFFIDFGVTKLSLAGDWKYRIEKFSSNSSAVGPNSYPTLLFNAMINPITSYNLKGVLWYQGESNAGRAQQYKKSFPLMIEDWRNQWKDTLPFYFVQLTHFVAGGGTSSNGGSEWAELREAQEETLRLPNTGMAVIIDIGESNDIHPRNKQDVGKRLAAIALAKAYHRQVAFEGPHISSIDFAGGVARLKFNNVEDGWKINNKYGYINGFELAGADRHWYYARAWVDNGQIVVSSDSVKAPVAVRYGWADDPADLNLFNNNGLPAIPFRSDKWPGKTDGRGFSF